MKKLYFTFLLLSTVITTVCAQAAYADWNNFYYVNGKGVNSTVQDADTAYFTIGCRNGKFQYMASRAAGSLTAQALPTSYDAGDSLTWKVIKGAPVGTKPRVRIINIKSGEYLKQGTVNGVLSGYVAPYYDNVTDGQLDFFLQYQSSYCYFIVGKGNTQFYNDATGLINVKNSTSTSQGWKFTARKGPLPKPAITTPSLSLTTDESSFSATGAATFRAKVTKGANDLKGSTLLYIGETFLDTLKLDANGEASRVYSNLTYGKNIFTLVYTGDDNYGTEYVRDTLNVGASPLAVATKVNLSIPATSELYKDATLDINVQTITSDIVNGGDVLVYVNGILKNRKKLDSFGTTSINYPNLLVGNTNIKAVYIGDKMSFLDSDTARTSIQITSSAANVVPYPVYFDLNSQFEVTDWVRKNPTLTSTTKYTHSFRTDSLSGITVTDTINNTFKIAINGYVGAYDKIGNCYNHADNVLVPLGSSRPTSVKFKTPWLNAGAYNIYISHRRVDGSAININSVTLDDKELYWPSEEMTGRWFRLNTTANNYRRWNAKGTDANMSMHYLGSVNTANSGAHTLKINVASENGTGVYMDMLQFIPVDQDSVTINLSAANSMAKLYYPMFSWTGFSYMAGYDPATVQATFADNSNLALPYQAVDVTDWGTKYPFTVTGIDVDTVMNGTDPVYANYVTIYKAEDKWTRVSEGYASNGIYAGELPQGKYYYETINYTDLGDGAYDFRRLVKTGYFDLPLTATTIINNSSIKAYSFDHKLCIKGIVSGAKVIVSDLTGRILVNTITKSDNYSTALKQGVYIVKIISGESFTAKVLVR